MYGILLVSLYSEYYYNMENNEIKKGDTIICINNGILKQYLIPPPLKLNGEYICQNIRICPCGHKSFDVGITHDINNLLNCSECSRKTSGEDIRWCAASRFIKKKSKEEQIAEALEKEDYETLHKLTLIN